MSTLRKRDLNLDFIRASAGFLVICVHSMLNNGYYETTLASKKMLAMTLMRSGFMVCVPLFLLLTGYLCYRKKLTPRYYFGASQIVMTYGLCSLFCLLVRVFYYKQEIGLPWAIQMVFNFSAAPYSWYIEMYLGLFLFIPFLNVMYNGLESKRAKQLLVLTVFTLTSLPSLVNLLLGWQIIPDWWVEFYPITYYIIGAYLGEYRPTVRWCVGVPALFGTVLALGCYNYYTQMGGTFQLSNYNYWMGAGVVIASVLLFILMQKLPLDGLPNAVKALITRLANLSLGIYLVSWCFDYFVYTKLAARVVDMPSRLWYLPITILTVYCCSAVSAQLVEWVRVILTKAINRAVPDARLK